MGEFEQWLKSLNENGRVTYFLGQEGKVAKEAWDFQQSKIEQLENKLKEIDKSIDTFFDEQVGTPTAREYSNFIADMQNTLRGAP